MTEDELLDYARAVIRGEKPLFELSHMIAGFRKTSFTRVMFGPLEFEGDARKALKNAEYEAQKGRGKRDYKTLGMAIVCGGLVGWGLGTYLRPRVHWLMGQIPHKVVYTDAPYKCFEEYRTEFGNKIVINPDCFANGYRPQWPVVNRNGITIYRDKLSR